ncbi:MAG: biopolymer transporter ExbD [Vampirovibrionales bacterium]|nr:biopolymer transporter ExbD [Vampirovibrionales bacterium]
MTPARKRVFNEINITPLTDIFLVLLIIMMVVAPMLDYPGLKLAVPTLGPDATVKTQPKTITVNVNANDQLSVDGRVIPDKQSLVSLLRQEKAQKPDGVIIASNPQSSHNATTTVMDAAQMAGVDKIAVTESQGGGGSGFSEQDPER